MKTFTALGIVFVACLCVSAQAQQKQTVLVFNGPISSVTITRLIAAVDERAKQGTTSLTILINSNGGDVDAASTAYNFLRGIPMSITTHNFGIVDSASVVLYCAGKVRLASPDSRFVIHGISLNFGPGASIDPNQLGELSRLVALQTDIMARIIGLTVNKSPEVVTNALNAKTVLVAEKAKDWGLVTGIETRLYDSGADVFIVPMQ